jgi:hypothetical protein
MALPKGWQWLDAWTILKGEGHGEEGFIYGFSFDELTFPPQPGASSLTPCWIARQDGEELICY